MFILHLNGTNQNNTVVCSATGGYPPITSISLRKNGTVIASAANESTLQVNKADIPPGINYYGLYICLVNLSGIPLQQSVVLKERGIPNGVVLSWSYKILSTVVFLMLILYDVCFRLCANTIEYEQRPLYQVDCKLQ